MTASAFAAVPAPGAAAGVSPGAAAAGDDSDSAAGIVGRCGGSGGRRLSLALTVGVGSSPGENGAALGSPETWDSATAAATRSLAVISSSWSSSSSSLLGVLSSSSSSSPSSPLLFYIHSCRFPFLRLTVVGPTALRLRLERRPPQKVAHQLGALRLPVGQSSLKRGFSLPVPEAGVGPADEQLQRGSCRPERSNTATASRWRQYVKTN